MPQVEFILVGTVDVYIETRKLIQKNAPPLSHVTCIYLASGIGPHKFTTSNAVHVMSSRGNMQIAMGALRSAVVNVQAAFVRPASLDGYCDMTVAKLLRGELLIMPLAEALGVKHAPPLVAVDGMSGNDVWAAYTRATWGRDAIEIGSDRPLPSQPLLPQEDTAKNGNDSSLN